MQRDVLSIRAMSSTMISMVDESGLSWTYYGLRLASPSRGRACFHRRCYHVYLMLYSSKILKLVGGLFIFVMPPVVCTVLLISCQAAVALSCVLVANQAAALGYDRPLRLLHHLCTVQVHMRVCILASPWFQSHWLFLWLFMTIPELQRKDLCLVFL